MSLQRTLTAECDGQTPWTAGLAPIRCRARLTLEPEDPQEFGQLLRVGWSWDSRDMHTYCPDCTRARTPEEATG